VHGQSASHGGQRVTKIEAKFLGWGWNQMFPACSLLVIVGSKYDRDKNDILTLD